MPLELDYMEYANDAAAQAAYPSSEVTDDVVDQEETTQNDEGSIYGDGGTQERRAQEFQVSGNITCSKIAASLKKAGSPTDNIEARIETDAAGLPSGTLVDVNATKSIACSGLTTSFVWYDFVFPATFSLSSGTVYHLVFQRSGVRNVGNNPLVGLDITAGYPSGTAEMRDSGTWTNKTYDLSFKIYKRVDSLQDYSESTIKQQGSYSLKGIAKQTYSLNETLIRTIGSPIDLSNRNTIKFDIRASRTGAHIKVSIRDSGAVWTEKTYTVLAANTWETVTWDISGVSNANKDAIDRIKITILNADADNTFYLDNMFAEAIGVAVNSLFFGSNF